MESSLLPESDVCCFLATLDDARDDEDEVDMHRAKSNNKRNSPPFSLSLSGGVFLNGFCARAFEEKENEISPQKEVKEHALYWKRTDAKSRAASALLLFLCRVVSKANVFFFFFCCPGRTSTSKVLFFFF
jgi:hypothetical protein